IAGELFGQIWHWNQSARAGWVLPAEASFQCFPEAPDRVRRPDTAFVSRERTGGEPLPRGHARVAPDLAVEVISPNDVYGDVHLNDLVRAHHRLASSPRAGHRLNEEAADRVAVLGELRRPVLDLLSVIHLDLERVEGGAAVRSQVLDARGPRRRVHQPVALDAQ